MTDRERLFQLIGEVQDGGYDISDVVELNYTTNNQLIDHLIANGVTFAADNNVGHKWISVAERLPEPETNVLTYCYGCIDILTYRYNKRGNACFMFRDDCGYWKETFTEISYWMPLPEAPKEE